MILVDVSGLVACLNRADRHHEACREALRAAREPLATCWPVLAETMAVLAGRSVARDAVWEMVRRRALAILPLGDDDVPRLRQLMAKHRSMDVSAAALVRLAEREKARTVLTLRRGLGSYRISGRRRLEILPR